MWHKQNEGSVVKVPLPVWFYLQPEFYWFPHSCSLRYCQFVFVCGRNHFTFNIMSENDFFFWQIFFAMFHRCAKLTAWLTLCSYIYPCIWASFCLLLKLDFMDQLWEGKSASISCLLNTMPWKVIVRAPIIEPSIWNCAYSTVKYGDCSLFCFSIQNKDFQEASHYSAWGFFFFLRLV